VAAPSFVWGGQSWGPGDLAAFTAYLKGHGVSYATWAANHAAAAEILTSVPYNPYAYPPGGSSEEVAAAIVAAGLTNPGPNPVFVPAAVATEVLPAAGTGPAGPVPVASLPPPPPVVQVRFTHDDLVNLWLSVGGPAGSADIAAAVALAESGGCKWAHAGPTDTRPEASCTYRRTDGENSDGLWQINRRAHPEYSDADLYDASGNAAAAVAVSSGGTNFAPWSTFTSGAFQQYLTGSPSTGGLISASPPVAVSTVTRPAGVAAAWANLIDGVAGGVPATHAQVVGLRDSMIDIFRG
jgi:hypothetical protein